MSGPRQSENWTHPEVLVELQNVFFGRDRRIATRVIVSLLVVGFGPGLVVSRRLLRILEVLKKEREGERNWDSAGLRKIHHDQMKFLQPRHLKAMKKEGCVVVLWSWSRRRRKEDIQMKRCFQRLERRLGKSLLLCRSFFVSFSSFVNSCKTRLQFSAHFSVRCTKPRLWYVYLKKSNKCSTLKSCHSEVWLVLNDKRRKEIWPSLRMSLRYCQFTERFSYSGASAIEWKLLARFQ